VGHFSSLWSARAADFKLGFSHTPAPSNWPETGFKRPNPATPLFPQFPSHRGRSAGQIARRDFRGSPFRAVRTLCSSAVSPEVT
jgi:hypothetical protein